MIKKVTVHICDICGKEDNLGDKYESGSGELRLKGSIGYDYANGGASWDDTYDLCLDCFKKFRKLIGEEIKKHKKEKK